MHWYAWVLIAVGVVIGLVIKMAADFGKGGPT
jgi:hypothetical protein